MNAPRWIDSVICDICYIDGWIDRYYILNIVQYIHFKRANVIAKVVLIFVNNSMRRKLKNHSLKFCQPHIAITEQYNIHIISTNSISIIFMATASNKIKNGPTFIETWTHRLWISFDFVHILWLSLLLYGFIRVDSYTYATILNFESLNENTNAACHTIGSVGSNGTHIYAH